MQEEIVRGWLLFKRDKVSETGKTEKWYIIHKDKRTVLGYIQWKRGWRQYWFEPSSEKGFTGGCLRDILLHIDELMARHRERCKKQS